MGVPYLDVLELWPQLKEGFHGYFEQDGVPYHFHLDVRVFIDEQQTVVV
jgi:hypothetical protein